MKKITALTFLISIFFLLTSQLGSLLAGQILFQDNFESRSTANWQLLNPDRWQIVYDEGDYSCYLNTSSYKIPGDNQLGEYALVKNLIRMNFVFECDIRSPEPPENDGADLGIIFGYKDANNYYNMIFNRYPAYTELSIVVNGLGTSLASYPVGVLQDHNYHHIKVQRLGTTIKAYIDGTQIISCEDATFLSGQMGIGSRNDMGYFDNVVVKDYDQSIQPVTVVDSLISPAINPYGIASDGTNLWVGDNNTGKAIKINNLGTKLNEITMPDGIIPVALQWMAPSYLWIADHIKDRIIKVDVNTNASVSSFGAPGGICSGLTWDGNYFWITDKNRNAIYKYDLSGNQLASIIGPTAHHCGLVAEGSFLWIVSTADGYLFKTDKSGRLQSIFDIPGGEARDITFDGTFFYLVDGLTKKIYKFTTSGYTPPPSEIILTFNQIDPSSFPAIAAYVSVTDRTGNPITGLSSSHFSVLESNSIQSPISVVSVGGSAVPVAAALVIDRSGSMQGQPLQDAKTAAKAFVNALSTNDRAAVVSFASDVTTNQGFTGNKTYINNSIDNLSATGLTSLYDAIIEGVTLANTQTGRKAIIALTDGDDTDSYYNIDDCIAQARAAGLPVYTIGLGSVKAQVLERIANETGGRYFYAPTSNQLLQIYQLISQQLQNQYKITYTSNNSAFDCSIRSVQINVNYQSSSDSKTKSYQAPCSQNIPISPVCNTSVQAGQDFWLDIQIGNNSQPVSNLFAVSFVLNYQTTYLDVSLPHSSSVIAGSFIGSDIVFFQDVNDGNGAVSVGVSRKSGAAGVSGYGTVTRIHFIASSSIPNGTTVVFTLSSLSAIDPLGTPIVLSPQSLSLTVSAGATVWPGDANNDGYVDQSDILPLGLFFNQSGASRPGAPNNLWQAQFCSPFWTPINATYADCDGNGTINQADVFAIGLNWRKSHGFSLAKTEDAASFKPDISEARIAPFASTPQIPGSDFEVMIKIYDVQQLFGLSFQLAISDTEFVDIKEAKLGDFLGTDILSLPPIIDSTTKTISVGMTRKSGQGGVSDSGVVLKTKWHLHANTPKGLKIIFRIINLRANDESGNQIEFLNTADTLQVADVHTQLFVGSEMPTGFRVKQNYPNPFNASTRIEYELPRACLMCIAIHNMEGRLVRRLVESVLDQGRHIASWDGRDESGHVVAAGIYFCHFQTDEFSHIVRMILIK